MIGLNKNEKVEVLLCKFRAFEHLLQFIFAKIFVLDAVIHAYIFIQILII